MLISGGASAVKEPGHFEVRKSSSQITRSQGRSQDFTLWDTEAERRGGIGVARIFSGGALFKSKKLTTFLVGAFKTQAANAADIVSLSK